MTCVGPHHGRSTFDLPVDIAGARMAALRDEVQRSRLTSEGASDGVARRLRHAIGHRLIGLGSALVTEGRPGTLAR